MAKYHISAKGEAALCKARAGNCPLGDELEHYTTPENAMTAFEKVMSGTSGTGFAKTRPWATRSWQSRKRQLESFLRGTLEEAGLPSISVEWKDEAEPGRMTAGLIVWEETEPQSDKYVAVKLVLSEFMEHLAESTARDIVVHEMAHLKAGDNHESSSHGDNFKEAFAAICSLASHDRHPTARTVISDDELSRIAKRKLVEPGRRWQITCARGHQFNVSVLPPIRGPCSHCRDFKPAEWTRRDRRNKMGFTSKTLPPERENFFGNKVPALNGINVYEWYPTDDEYDLIVSLMSTTDVDWSLVKEGVSLERRLYYWLTEHFTSDRYTQDYTYPVDERMVKRGIEEFTASDKH